MEERIVYVRFDSPEPTEWWELVASVAIVGIVVGFIVWLHFFHDYRGDY